MSFPVVFHRAVFLLALLALPLVSASSVMANAAPPDDEIPLRLQTVNAPLKVTKHNAPTRIKIPASVLAQLKAVAGSNRKTGIYTPDSRTLFAGFALAVAAVCAFVVLGKRVSSPRRVATAAVLLAAGLFLVTDATADLIVDGPINGPAKERPRDQVILEVVADGKTIELLVNKNAKWAK